MRCQISLPVTHQQRELGLSNKYVTNQKKVISTRNLILLLRKEKQM